MNPTHFFIFSLGPVQSFIAQARKAQDLYLGCRMISDYCRCAAFAFQQTGGQIIFPKIQSESLTNRFVGIITLANQDAGKQIGESIAQTVQNRFVEEGLAAIRAGLGGNINPEDIIGMREQLEAHLQTYWVFSPYDSQNYAASYQEAERVFGMSKHLRTPKVLTYQGAGGGYNMFATDFLGETGRKCLVDGELNVKVYRWSDQDSNRHQNNPQELMRHKLFFTNRQEVVLVGNQSDTGPFASIEQVPPKFIQDGEGLSAISFFKRCYLPDGIDYGGMKNSPDHWNVKPYNTDIFWQGVEVSTTAKIALLDVLTKAKASEQFGSAFSRLESFIHHSRPSNFDKKYPNYRAEDEELYFEENLTEAYFRKYIFDPRKLDEIRTAHQGFKTALSRQGIQLQPYYALVALDVDGLGKHLQKLDTQQAHEETASKLHKFATAVGELIGSEKGELLHAGGDDFLLMINLYGLFNTLNQIQQKWSELATGLSYSAAVLISHYKSPLTRAVKTVKAELKAVKTRFKDANKNGVSFCFMAKSGAVSTCHFKQDKLTLLNELFEALQARKYSPKFIFQFARNMEEMGFHGETSSEEQETLRAFALSELRRLLVRARDTQEVSKEAAAMFGNQFAALLTEQVRDGGNLLDLSNFVQFLKMAELAAKHTNQWQEGTFK
ncbi:MAG: type III-B CRISPR-associated protein Cas10/Cmr2 [Bacteroidia bacterium]|nr:type III-B CRISPR-associated protein Cas10/Cmr2 [Bacteroidia bacterium]